MAINFTRNCISEILKIFCKFSKKIFSKNNTAVEIRRIWGPIYTISVNATVSRAVIRFLKIYIKVPYRRKSELLDRSSVPTRNSSANGGCHQVAMSGLVGVFSGFFRFSVVILTIFSTFESFHFMSFHILIHSCHTSPHHVWENN